MRAIIWVCPQLELLRVFLATGPFVLQHNKSRPTRHVTWSRPILKIFDSVKRDAHSIRSKAQRVEDVSPVDNCRRSIREKRLYPHAYRPGAASTVEASADTTNSDLPLCRLRV